MPELGNVTVGVGDSGNAAPTISTDESIGGLLFDLSGFDAPFSQFPQCEANFGNGQVCLVNNLNEAAALGLGDNGFLGGVVHYHLSSFYDYVGGDAPLYIAFKDCTDGWEYIEDMQHLADGKIFQLGVWTSQMLVQAGDQGEIGLTSLAYKMEEAAELLCGKIGKASMSPVPLNIILSANTCGTLGSVRPNRLPDLMEVNAPKVSVLLCQNNVSSVSAIQAVLPDNAPVGSIGIAMAILSLAGVEESVGAVANYNLNKDDKFQNPAIPLGSAQYLPSDVDRVSLSMLSSCGYIVPVEYDGREGEYFFSNDTTLGGGDYGSIANNRVMHKCRRALYSVLLPYVNSHYLFDSSGRMSQSSASFIISDIGRVLDGVMVNKMGQGQISGREIEVSDTGDSANDDTLIVKLTITPAGYNEQIVEAVST